MSAVKPISLGPFFDFVCEALWKTLDGIKVSDVFLHCVDVSLRLIDFHFPCVCVSKVLFTYYGGNSLSFAIFVTIDKVCHWILSLFQISEPEWTSRKSVICRLPALEMARVIGQSSCSWC